MMRSPSFSREGESRTMTNSPLAIECFGVLSAWKVLLLFVSTHGRYTCRYLRGGRKSQKTYQKPQLYLESNRTLDAQACYACHSCRSIPPPQQDALRSRRHSCVSPFLDRLLLFFPNIGAVDFCRNAVQNGFTLAGRVRSSSYCARNGNSSLLYAGPLLRPTNADRRKISNRRYCGRVVVCQQRAAVSQIKW